MLTAALQTRVRAFIPGRTRPFSNTSLSALLERLSGEIGSESATMELRWMQEELRARRAVDGASATPSSSNNGGGAELGELREMVDRRVKGEPLQYILGEYGSTLPKASRFETSPSHEGVGVGWLLLKQQK